MPTTIYDTHRAINRPVRFKGLVAQYLVMTAAALVLDLLLFIILYITGLNPLADMALAFGLGAAAVSTAYRLSRKYGEYGLMKKRARKKVPKYIRFRSHPFLKNKQTLWQQNLTS